MIQIPNDNHDPALNLAMEEYILSSSGIMEPVLFFYINAPSVIIGRHQNTLDEIDINFVREKGIQIVRRCSGGGAVYHDHGNLNYSLISPGDSKAVGDFSVLLTPILNALHALGLPAQLGGRNDLLLDGAKFSGNAYYHNQFGSVTHGTLLYDTDLTVLSQALRPDFQKLKTKGISSVRSRVCCIKSALPDIKSIDELEEAILRFFMTKFDVSIRNFSQDDMMKIQELAEKRYRSDLWTYGQSPAYNIRHMIRQQSGWIDFRADVRENVIQNVRFFGDFFCPGDISKLENAFPGNSWEKSSVRDLLEAEDWDSYFPGYALDTFLEELFSGKGDA